MGERLQTPVAEREREAAATRILAVLMVVAFGGWTVFDHVLEPADADTFLRVRVLAEIPMLAALVLLWRDDLDPRWRVPLLTGMFASGQIAIAWMLPSLDGGLAYYVMGYSLVPLGSGCLMPGRCQWTALQIAITLGAFGIAVAAAGPAMSRTEVVGSGFYLVTACAIALVAHVLRDQLTRREAVARAELDHEQERTRELLRRLERLSLTDPLTGLANRRRWDAALQTACTDESRLAVVLVDLDHFKAINDRHGHGSGDRALQDVARLLEQRAGPEGIAARLGGDEFGLLIAHADHDGLHTLADGLRDAVAQLPPAAPEGARITVSVGAAPLLRGETAGEVTRRADRELYRAKAVRNAAYVAAPLAA